MDVDGPEPQADEAFDLEAYAAQYSGHAKIDRLLFIADRSAGRPAELEALKLAAAELKASTQNTLKYAEVIERIGGRAGLEFAPDRRAGPRRVARPVAVACGLRGPAPAQGGCLTPDRLDRLEGELASFKTNLVKESIRLGHIDLGAFCYRRGDLLLGNYMHVTNYVQKAEAALETQPDPLVRAKLAAASGLNLLEQGRYKLAARKFADVSPDLGTSYNDVIALQARAWGRWHDGKCSGDIHLHDHAAALYQAIRNKALVQARVGGWRYGYTTPFAALDLNAMAAAFNTGVGGLEEELAALIGSREIAARIDSHAKARRRRRGSAASSGRGGGARAAGGPRRARQLPAPRAAPMPPAPALSRSPDQPGVLYAKKLNQRGSTYQQALRAGEEYLASTKALLLRASILQHDLIQKPIGGGPGGPGGPDRPDGPPGRPGRRHGGGGEHRPGRRGGGPRGGGSGGSGASGSGGRGEDEGGREERAGGFFAAMLGRVAGGGGI
eukprot:scaffold4.g5019.t1